MVTKHLLTPEVFKEKLVNPSTKKVLEDTIKVQFNTLKEKNIRFKTLWIELIIHLKRN